MSKQKTDYWSWGMSELIERIEELESQLEGSVYTLKGGIMSLPDIDETVNDIAKQSEDMQQLRYADLVLTHDQAVNRFKSMLGETQQHNAYLVYLEELITKLQKRLNIKTNE